MMELALSLPKIQTATLTAMEKANQGRSSRTAPMELGEWKIEGNEVTIPPPVAAKQRGMIDAAIKGEAQRLLQLGRGHIAAGPVKVTLQSSGVQWERQRNDRQGRSLRWELTGFPGTGQ